MELNLEIFLMVLQVYFPKCYLIQKLKLFEYSKIKHMVFFLYLKERGKTIYFIKKCELFLYAYYQ